MSTTQNTEGKALKSYVVGFVLSLILTFGAYGLVTGKIFDGTLLITLLLVLAFAQLLVQLFFFLHLGREKNPRWQLFFLLGTTSGILLLVVGSIWIMNHLNHNMMPKQMDQYLMKDEGMKK
jgi:cytochrome o ubiquinol oxidase operon protein cyoD